MKLVILIAIPEQSAADAHLKIIAALARSLMHEEYRESLLRASTREAVVNAVRKRTSPVDYSDDRRTVMTLDAGGTNFVFSAIQGNREIVTEITLPSNADNLDRCIASLMEGFSAVRSRLSTPAAAISFAFPGPADYRKGIIGDLGNLPAFRGGVALGPLLEDTFSLPVFINNDGDLYAYGEAIAGFLPSINAMLENARSPKRFRNLLGVTLERDSEGGSFATASSSGATIPMRGRSGFCATSSCRSGTSKSMQASARFEGSTPGKHPSPWEMLLPRKSFSRSARDGSRETLLRR